MDWLGWLIIIVAVLVALGRRAASARRVNVAQLERQIAQHVEPLPPIAKVAAAAPTPRPRQAPIPPAQPLSPRPTVAATDGRAPWRRTLREAFSDPAHARTAVVLAEILGPPRGLR